MHLALTGCVRANGESALAAPTIAPTVQIAEAASARPRAPVDIKDALIVGNEDGLVLWKLDGSAHYMLSEGAALHPRLLGGDAVLALSGELSSHPGGVQLVRVSLADGSRAVVGTLPPYACANAAPADEQQAVDLEIQDPNDFAVDPDGKHAYLTFMDRNSNMANLQVKMLVELATGQVARWQTVGEPECLPPSGVELGEPDEEQWRDLYTFPDDEAGPTRYAYDFDADTGWVEKLGTPVSKHMRLPDYNREQTSPSGRWLVLGGDLQEGDYIHRSLVVLDREQGTVFPLLEEPGAWPAPLTAAKRTAQLPAAGTADVVGESDVRWLSFPNGTELLIVDQLVFQPNQASWAFEGELAR